MTSATTAAGKRLAPAPRAVGRGSRLTEHAPWAAASLLVGLVTVALGRGAGSLVPFFTGFVAGAMFLAGFLFAFRRRLAAPPFVSSRPFYLGHAWLTTAGLGVAAFHAGRIPRGMVGITLVLGFALSIATGFALIAVHALFKRAMAAIEDEALLPEDILEGRTRHARELSDLLASSSPDLMLKLRREVLGRLGRLAVLGAALGGRDALARLRSAVEQSALTAAALPQEEQAVVRRAISVRLEHRVLELQSLLHGLREAWVTLHVVLAAGTLGLLGLHVLLVIAFRG